MKNLFNNWYNSNREELNLPDLDTFLTSNVLKTFEYVRLFANSIGIDLITSVGKVFKISIIDFNALRNAGIKLEAFTDYDDFSNNELLRPFKEQDAKISNMVSEAYCYLLVQGEQGDLGTLLAKAVNEFFKIKI